MPLAAYEACDHLLMVMEPVPSYDDLILLFEPDPVNPHKKIDQATGADPDWQDQWPYTSVTFQTMRAGYGIQLDIEPGYEIVRLRLHSPAGAELVNLELQGVRTVGVERGPDRELLRVDFPHASPASTLWLRMKPDVSIVWAYESVTRP